MGVSLKGKAADNWTNLAPIGEPPQWEVTGWHWPSKHKPEPEPPQPVVSRGLVTGTRRRATSAKERQGTLL